MGYFSADIMNMMFKMMLWTVLMKLKKNVNPKLRDIQHLRNAPNGQFGSVVLKRRTQRNSLLKLIAKKFHLNYVGQVHVLLNQVQKNVKIGHKL